jgi:hypothetical protein
MEKKLPNSFEDFKKDFVDDKRNSTNTIIAANMREYLEYAKLRTMDRQIAILAHLANNINDLKNEIEEINKILVKTSK